MSNSYDDIAKELGLDGYTVEEKQASSAALMTEPLASEIQSFLRETENLDKISSISQAIDIIEKEVGEEVFVDELKNFVFSVEVAGYTKPEILDFMEKEAGVGSKIISLLGGDRMGQLQEKARRLYNTAAISKAQTPGVVSQILSGHARNIQRKPGMISRLKGAMSGSNPYAALKLDNEAKAVRAIQELGALDPAIMKPIGLGKYFGPSKGVSHSKLREMLTIPKAPKVVPTVIPPGLSNLQVAGLKAGDQMQRFNRYKHRNAYIAGAGGLGLATLAASNNDSRPPMLSIG